jgi:hypothetical protein
MRTIELPALSGSKLVTTIDVGDELRILGRLEEALPGRPTWRVLTEKDGDVRLSWDVDDAAETREAMSTFKKLVDAGMKAYACDAKGKPTRKELTAFDPAAGDIVFAPAKLAVGG